MRRTCKGGKLSIFATVPGLQCRWFVLRAGQYERLPIDASGLLRSEAFAGLWLDPAALLRGDLATVLTVVQQGLASPEHAAFVNRLHPPAATP